MSGKRRSVCGSGYNPFTGMRTIMDRKKWQQDHGLWDRRRRFLLNAGWKQTPGWGWTHERIPDKGFGLTAATKEECVFIYEVRCLEAQLEVMWDYGVVEVEVDGAKRQGPRLDGLPPDIFGGE